MPLIFAYTPLIGGDFGTVARIGLFSLFGIYAFNALLQRHSEGPLSWWMYPLLIAGGAAAFYPLHWAGNIIGALVVLAVISLSTRIAK